MLDTSGYRGRPVFSRIITLFTHPPVRHHRAGQAGAACGLDRRPERGNIWERNRR
jgi:hypothetical protein